jgi:NitT/TauT family transport system substrate-binding protein
MKKLKYLFISLIFIIICILLFNKKDNNTELQKVKVAEVAHSIFYAPQYVAIHNNYFKELGLDVDIIDQIVDMLTILNKNEQKKILRRNVNGQY